MNITNELLRAYHQLIGELQNVSFYCYLAEQIAKTPIGELRERENIGLHFGPFRLDNTDEEKNVDLLVNSFGLYSSRYSIVALGAVYERYLFSLLYAAKIFKRFVGKGTIPSQEFVQIGNETRDIVRRYSAPRIYTFIEEEIQQQLNLKNQKYFDSIYSLRNCVVHRGGIVGADDLKGNPFYELEWLKVVFFANERRLESVVGAVLQGGESLIMKYENEMRKYSVNDSVVIYPVDIQHISFTLMVCAEESKNSLNEIFHAKLGQGAT